MSDKTPIPPADMEPHPCHALLGAKETQGLDTPCRLHFHSKRHRLADPDGLSAKAAIDGLVHAGILRNDTPKEIESVTFSQEKITKSEDEETIVTIEWHP